MKKLLILAAGVVLLGLGSVSAEIVVKYSFETGTAPTDTVGPVFTDGNAGPSTFLTPGISGQALGFATANTGWATAGTSASEFKITSDFTVTMWVNMSAAAALRTRLITTADANTGGTGWRLLVAGNGSSKVAFEGNGVGGSTIDNTFTTLQDVQQDAWTFVALRYANDGNATATVLYQSQLGGDAALVAANSASVASDGAMSYGATAVPKIGVTQNLGATPRFHGAFDEISLYNTALTDAELSGVFNAAIPEPATLGLVGVFAVGMLGIRRILSL
ncbi:MAG: LamG domain-containing protein [Kiritimatiellales bacterium]|nr:LamG domain-containing protein [Kiritimatiellales bacterium]MCF7863775.1 LamG domain-containing protein [Kiritimatiellales bacterium]